MKAIVIGGGVSGFSCGIYLMKAGFETTIVSEKWSPNTTSDVAAAVWYPFTVEPLDRVAEWGKKAYKVFLELSKNESTGIHIVPGYDLFGIEMEEQWWSSFIRDVRKLASHEIPENYKDGFYLSTPIIDMRYYMPWLDKEFAKFGGKKITQKLENIEEVCVDNDLVVNCSGLGAKSLCDDASVFPIKGQIVKVEAPEVKEFRQDFKNGPNTLAYIIPRKDNCVLGGTTEINNWNEDVDLEVSAQIQQRCSALIPSLKDAKVISHNVGLRPGRKAVRLELDTSLSKPVIHNYGHGGAGVTISWGCAYEVLQLAQECKGK